MKQENLNNLKEAKKDLQRIIQNFEGFHQKGEGESDTLDKKETEFAKWYYGEGKAFNKFSSYIFLDKYYNEFLSPYNNYFETKKKPIQKGFFSDGISKRKSELDNFEKKIALNGEKFLSAIDMFIQNVERSKIIERAKGTEDTETNKIQDLKISKENQILDNETSNTELSSVLENLEVSEENQILDSETSSTKELYSEALENIELEILEVSEENQILDNETSNTELSSEVLENLEVSEENQILDSETSSTKELYSEALENIELETLEVSEENQILYNEISNTELSSEVLENIELEKLEVSEKNQILDSETSSTKELSSEALENIELEILEVSEENQILYNETSNTELSSEILEDQISDNSSTDLIWDFSEISIEENEEITSEFKVDNLDIQEKDFEENIELQEVEETPNKEKIEFNEITESQNSKELEPTVLEDKKITKEITELEHIKQLMKDDFEQQIKALQDEFREIKILQNKYQNKLTNLEKEFKHQIRSLGQGEFF